MSPATRPSRRNSPLSSGCPTGCGSRQRAAEVLRLVYDATNVNIPLLFSVERYEQVIACCASYRQLLDCIEPKLVMLPVAAATR